MLTEASVVLLNSKGTRVTSTIKLAAGTGMIILFLSVSVYAQAAGSELNHFTANWISFDHPSGY